MQQRCSKCGCFVAKVSEKCGYCNTRIREKEITVDCVAILTKSTQNAGFYVDIRYRGKSILALGLADHFRININNKFIVKKARNATVSFNIFEV